MARPSRNRSLPKKNPFFTNLQNALIFLALAGIVVILIFLFSPLPKAKMPVASEVFDCNQQLVDTFYNQNRRAVTLEEIPPFLIKAFLAVEDHRFYQHYGLNPGRIIKAAWHDLRHNSLHQGGSTITQQLAKNAYLSHERTFMRKIKEAFLAIKLELHFSKNKILELYLNQIYFGHGAYGVKVAAQTYFGKSIAKLNQAELALMAGLPKGPAYYSPYLHPEAARKRIKSVLYRMQICNYISAAEYEAYSQQKLSLPGLKNKTKTAPYFMDFLQNEIAQIFPDSPGIIFTEGLKIESTLDLTMQQAAEKALQKGLPKLFRNQKGIPQPQGALIAINPTNGEIKALVGGSDYTKTQFNRAYQAKRQPGSSFKPIVYATALKNNYTLATQLDQTPQTYFIGSKAYRPLDNNKEDTTGNLSLRRALASSSNVISVKLLNEIGIPPVIQLAGTLGISSRLPKQLSLALGSGEVTPLELLTAYLPLANKGIAHQPFTIKKITARDGSILYAAKPKKSPVLDPGIAFLVTQALTDVLRPGGTAANIRYLLKRPAAGKTGTTEKNRDAWFVGYTPDLATCVYVGCDNNRSLPGSASRIAAPIWARFMRKALAKTPAHNFHKPTNVVKTNICQDTGLRATTLCPRRGEYFILGTEPKNFCEKHRYVRMLVCEKSGLLPGPYCRRIKEDELSLTEQPTETCRLCRKRSPRRLFDWLKRLFE